MAARTDPSTQYSSSQFVVSAGCVLFRKQNDVLEICILHERNKKEWVLPKGRKDIGESTAEAAVRETYEETGWRCELLPVRMATRAPRPGVNSQDKIDVVSDICEPFSVVVRDRGERGVKMVWWYVARSMGGEKVLGTQTDWEAFDSEWVEAEEACARMTFKTDMDAARQALQLVKNSGMRGL
ncbi:Nudix hydrolase domain-containing protein [Mycena kentingensis (nom. inval.)]|nr:Nudix hydrolase domain-containing protein [Mycena kentingensis (nom. inval.)]